MLLNGMVLPELHIAATLGLLLAISVAVGLLAEEVRLPKVTAYLAVGIVFGPSVLDLVPHVQIVQLNPLLKLAMGLVLFQLGSQFPLGQLKRMLRRLIPFSLSELAFTFVLVSVSVWAVTSDLAMALLLGALSLSTAPATTMLVLKESESEGPVTDLTGGLVAINNFASIVVFELIYLAIHFFSENGRLSLSSECLFLFRDIGGSLALGTAAGLLASFACGLLQPGRWLVLLVAGGALLLGLCETFHLPYMLAFLAMGMVVVNTSGQIREIQAELKHLTGLLTVTFFVIHGAELNLELLAQAGLIGGVYVAARSIGKYFGIRSVAWMMGESPAVRTWLGSCLLAQAGAAIALSAIAVERDPALGRQLQSIILGTVVVFELAGPVLIRHSVRQAGEMPILHAVHHTSATPWQLLVDIWTRLQTSVGRVIGSRSIHAEAKIEQIVRKHVPKIGQSASFSEVLKIVEHSHDDTYTVVDDSGKLDGIIRYRELSHALFDPAADALIRAVDIADPVNLVLHADDTISTAISAFRATADDCIPVIWSREDRNVCGVVRRRDMAKVALLVTTSGVSASLRARRS